MPETQPQRPDGERAAALATLVVQVTSEHTGRGPTASRAMVHDDVVTVVLHDTLTKGERNLVRDGKSELVLEVRRTFQRTMSEDLIAGVEAVMERRVVAFMSANHIDPDLAVETFILEGGRTR